MTDFRDFLSNNLGKVLILGLCAGIYTAVNVHGYQIGHDKGFRTVPYEQFYRKGVAENCFRSITMGLGYHMGYRDGEIDRRER